MKKKFEKELDELKIKKNKDFEIIEKKFFNKRLDLSQQQNTEKNISEKNGKISSRRNIQSYSGFQNNFETTTEPSKLNIYNNTNSNINSNIEEANIDNDNQSKNENEDDINGIEKADKNEENNETNDKEKKHD